jgi:hypothetical protein
MHSGPSPSILQRVCLHKNIVISSTNIGPPVIRLKGGKECSQLAIFDGNEKKVLGLMFILDRPRQSYREFVGTKM